MKKLLALGIGISLFILLTTINTFVLPRIPIQYNKTQFKSKIVCKDFMSDWVTKPKKLEYIECKKARRAQLNVLIARYRVSGKDAIAVESFLQKNFKMSSLRFVCCGWEPVMRKKNQSFPGIGRYNDKHYDYEIGMYSEETLVNERKRWGDIPFFYIQVIAYLEEP